MHGVVPGRRTRLPSCGRGPLISALFLWHHCHIVEAGNHLPLQLSSATQYTGAPERLNARLAQNPLITCKKDAQRTRTTLIMVSAHAWQAFCSVYCTGSLHRAELKQRGCIIPAVATLLNSPGRFEQPGWVKSTWRHLDMRCVSIVVNADYLAQVATVRANLHAHPCTLLWAPSSPIDQIRQIKIKIRSKMWNNVFYPPNVLQLCTAPIRALHLSCHKQAWKPKIIEECILEHRECNAYTAIHMSSRKKGTKVVLPTILLQEHT